MEYFTWARFISPPLRQILLARITQSHTLFINFPVSITNIGSQTGVIDSLYIELTNLSTRQTEKFYSWKEGSIYDSLSEELENLPKPIALKAGEGIVRFYTFCPHSLDFMYECGLYTISLYAYVNGKPIKLYKQKLQFDSIVVPNSPDQISSLHSYMLFPMKIFRVSDYGNITSGVSTIQIYK